MFTLHQKLANLTPLEKSNYRGMEVADKDSPVRFTVEFLVIYSGQLDS